ncbi:MAG TPA: hypothetical protein VEQ11_21800 [Chloroflexota bacterium]|nr:hypothetical protein [Chloroflexota bacterium]
MELATIWALLAAVCLGALWATRPGPLVQDPRVPPEQLAETNEDQPSL